MRQLHRILLTGGPCGGKSTALARLTDRLSSLGFRVFLVPEAATMLFLGGASLSGASEQQRYEFQKALVKLQLSLEESFLSLAKGCGGPAVLLYDRGALDPSAYVDAKTWQALLADLGTTQVELRDGRYDAVLHLVTAADGAEGHYSTSNNTARTETPEEARAIDKKLQHAYTGHPHLRVIDNAGGFDGKLHRVFEAVCAVTGTPRPIEIERKFLVRGVPRPLPIEHEEIEIEQTYLKTTDGTEGRVRRRGQRGANIYFHTIKRPPKGGQRVEIERQISAREYAALLSQADPNRRTIRKVRTCFLYENQYFELDRFTDPCAGLMMLEVELDAPERDVMLPPFVDIEREVTSKVEYTNYALAKS